MKSRILQSKTLETRVKEPQINPGLYQILNGNDVITAKVSDHHPVIHDGILFWNIMMQGKLRNTKGSVSYNNGFGIVEDDKQYKARLKQVGEVIAEIVYTMDIQMITLCEGPIQLSHVDVLLNAISQFPWMKRFTDLYKPHDENYPNWGLLLLTDSKNKMTEISLKSLMTFDIYEKLANRLQLWQITRNGKDKYIALGHFPFSGDEYTTDQEKLSVVGKKYCQIINKLLDTYHDKHFVICADFNFNPYLISHWKSRVVDQVTNNNSILFLQEEKSRNIHSVTVDGILLSQKEKQKYTMFNQSKNLLGILSMENSLFNSTMYKLKLNDVKFKEKYVTEKNDKYMEFSLRLKQ